MVEQVAKDLVVLLRAHSLILLLWLHAIELIVARVSRQTVSFIPDLPSQLKIAICLARQLLVILSRAFRHLLNLHRVRWTVKNLLNCLWSARSALLAMQCQVSHIGSRTRLNRDSLQHLRSYLLQITNYKSGKQ